MFVAILGVAAVLVAGRIRLGIVQAQRARIRNR
jgi:hypothetical protein